MPMPWFRLMPALSKPSQRNSKIYRLKETQRTTMCAAVACRRWRVNASAIDMNRHKP